jgi:hypothetical protein
MAIYTLWVTTGSDEHAGTDSNIFIKLIGTADETETLHLPPQDIFAFESGSVDKFVLEVPDLGDLLECCIGHDNSEGESNWYVQHVRVRQESNGMEWLFQFEQWLGMEKTGVLSACVRP